MRDTPNSYLVDFPNWKDATASFRTHDKSNIHKDAVNKSGDDEEKEGNFYQLSHLRTLDDPQLVDWTEKKVDKFTSPEIQNELLKIMSVTVLRCIAADAISATFLP